MTTAIAYTHSYPYRLLPFWSGKLQPVMPVQVYYASNPPLGIYTLLDSGADYPVFSVQVAARLGIDLTQHPKETLRGVAGGQRVHRQKLGLRFGPLSKPVGCHVYFIENFPVNLLGRVGVFDHAQIGLDEASKRVSVNHDSGADGKNAVPTAPW